MSDKPVAMYRENCADGSRCLHGCHTNEPCHTRPQPKAEQDKPVAWFWFDERDGGEWIHIADNQIDANKFGDVKIVPLYTHPQPNQPHPQPKAEKQEPVAVVTGMYGGRFIVEPTNSAMVLPDNMALYTHPQPREWIDLTDEETDAIIDMFTGDPWTAVEEIKSRLKEKNT